MFHGRETSRRIATAWASHSLVAAVRLLLRDALADPLNKRFVLMSGALCCAALCCAVAVAVAVVPGLAVSHCLLCLVRGMPWV